VRLLALHHCRSLIASCVTWLLSGAELEALTVLRQELEPRTRGSRGEFSQPNLSMVADAFGRPSAHDIDAPAPMRPISV
jgi:hypothetical protein